MALCRGTDAVTCQRKGGCEREKKKTGWVEARNAGRPHRQQDAAILVGAPAEMTCEVHRGGTEMCQLGRGFCHRLWFFSPRADACRRRCPSERWRPKKPHLLARSCRMRSVCLVIRPRLRRVMQRNRITKKKKKNLETTRNSNCGLNSSCFSQTKKKAQNVQGAAAFRLSNLPQQQSSSSSKCDTRAEAAHEGEEGPVTYVLGHKAIRSAFSEA